ncbi:reverse transcriptase domain-containing protein [Tanacetum coccineum]
MVVMSNSSFFRFSEDQEVVNLIFPVVISMIIALLQNKVSKLGARVAFGMNGVGPSGGGGGDAITPGISMFGIESLLVKAILRFVLLPLPGRGRRLDYRIYGESYSFKLGDAYADTTCTWVLFVRSFIKQYFLASEQQHMNALSMGDMSSWIERILGKTKGHQETRVVNDQGAHEVIGFFKQVLSIRAVRIGVMIRNDRIFGVRIRGLLVGMEMTARVRVTTTSASTGVSQLGILTRVMLQVLQVRGGLLRLCLLHLFVLTLEATPGVFISRQSRGCFTCGSTQHKVKDCPQGKQKQSMPADFARLPPTTGRVYATTRDQAAKTLGTITGILYIDDRTIFVLFDTGATHSIISTTFAKKLNMTPTPLIERVIISTPMKNHMLIDHEYVNCPYNVMMIRNSPANLPSNPYVPNFGEILAWIGWLLIELPLTAMLGLCQGFLASVMDTSLESPNIENLSVLFREIR